MTAIYLPVISSGVKGDFKFWRKECPVYCNNLLVSPFTTGWGKRRRDFGECKELTIYADSGGFQAVTMHKKISALDVLRWQERIADIAFTLDIPPHYYTWDNNRDYTQEELQKCMYQSIKNAELMREHQINDDMELWGVIQGRTFEECKIWYKDLTKNHTFDGYCIALSGNKSIKDFIEQMNFAKTIPNRIHFLGRSDQFVALVLAKLSQLIKLDYTYDTSSSKIGEMFGLYLNPITESTRSFSKDERKRDDVKVLPCNCPVCRKYSTRPKKLIYNTGLITLHNLYVKTSFCKFVNLIVSDDELFKFLLNQIISRRQYQKNRAFVESQIAGLFEYDNMLSSYEPTEALERAQKRIAESKDLTTIDNEFLNDFNLIFFGLKESKYENNYYSYGGNL